MQALDFDRSVYMAAICYSGPRLSEKRVQNIRTDGHDYIDSARHADQL